MPDPIELLAAHVVDTRYEDLPADVVAAAKTFILDTLGVGVAGSAGPWIGELIETCSLSMPGDQARVWVHGTSLSAAGAAMVNGYQIHNSEFDCVHEEAVVHTVTVPLAATLAVAERQGNISGQALITAIAVGVDVACHLSVAVESGLRFFRPATAGGMGAVASIGKILGFDKATMINAFGAMHGQLCGTMQAHTEGSALLAVQIGFNARNAVMACDIANLGMVAPQQVLSGEFGYFALFEGKHHLADVLPDVGRLWRITEVAHKPFPSGRATHGVLDACMELKREAGFSAEQVHKVVAHIPPLVKNLVGRPVTEDMHTNYARLCIPYVVACAFLNDKVSVMDFTPDALRDPARLALGAKVSIAPDDNPNPNALTPVSVEVHLSDGTVLTRTVETVYGNPAKPMSYEAQMSKLRTNLDAGARALPTAAAEHVSEMVQALETVTDVTRLVDAITV
ncbi:MAG: MmgE/PrpD family protein [Gammaproteobacteria bacterium]|nr:MmgE/PrpD family protein [Gammaproteobacteria bacterium]